MTTLDSDGNVRQQFKLEGDVAAGHQGRIGIEFGEILVHNVVMTGPNGNPEGYLDAGMTGQWHPNRVVKFDAMLGASYAGATVGLSGQPVSRRVIPITRLLLRLTPVGGAVQIGLGFNRSVYGLSPELVINRVIRDEVVVRPQLTLPSGWRLRGLAEMGPMTWAGEANERYNSEFTLAHSLGENSELYSSYGNLHYAKASSAGYYSPDRVQTFESGWSTDFRGRRSSVSLDFGIGTGRSKEHQAAFGPWGLSLRAQSDFTWTIRPGHELHASYEYEYNQFNPALLLSPAQAWSMLELTVFFRWATE